MINATRQALACERTIETAKACGAKVTQHEIGFTHAEFAQFLDALSRHEPEWSEAVAWEYRHLDTANTPHKWSEWKRCEPRNPYTQTAKDYADEIQAYIDRGYMYELRALYAHPPRGRRRVASPQGRGRASRTTHRGSS